MPGKGHRRTEGEVRLIDVAGAYIIGDAGKLPLIVGAGDGRDRCAGPGAGRIREQRGRIHPYPLGESAEPQAQGRQVSRRCPRLEAGGGLIVQHPCDMARAIAQPVQRSHHVAGRSRPHDLPHAMIEARARAARTGIVEQHEGSVGQGHAGSRMQPRGCHGKPVLPREAATPISAACRIPRCAPR